MQSTRPSQPTHIAGIIFDMDGTLIDSELHLEAVVHAILGEHHLSAEHFDFSSIYGITWESIARVLWTAFPTLEACNLASDLQQRFDASVRITPAPFIPGAKEFLLDCCAKLPTAIATSAHRSSMEQLIARMGAESKLHVAVSAEDYANSKPSPDCFLLAARRLGVAPEHCLVFEDSIAGLQGAKAAGMWAAAITHRCPDLTQAQHIADFTVRDFTQLPTDFVAEVMAPRRMGP